MPRPRPEGRGRMERKGFAGAPRVETRGAQEENDELSTRRQMTYIVFSKRRVPPSPAHYTPRALSDVRACARFACFASHCVRLEGKRAPQARAGGGLAVCLTTKDDGNSQQTFAKPRADLARVKKERFMRPLRARRNAARAKQSRPYARANARAAADCS